jgi:hypothetical protein
MELTYTDGAAVAKTARLKATSDDGVIFAEAEKLLASLFRRRVRIRRARLEAGSISRRPAQLLLFAEGDRKESERRERLHSALDHLRSKFPSGVAPAFGRAIPAVERCRQ